MFLRDFRKVWVLHTDGRKRLLPGSYYTKLRARRFSGELINARHAKNKVCWRHNEPGLRHVRHRRITSGHGPHSAAGHVKFFYVAEIDDCGTRICALHHARRITEKLAQLFVGNTAFECAAQYVMGRVEVESIEHAANVLPSRLLTPPRTGTNT